MSQYFKFDSGRNEFYTFTEDEEQGKLERVHLAGHYRFHFTYFYTDEMKKYSFRGMSYKPEYIDGLFNFESDNIDDLYNKLRDFIFGLEKNFPIVLYDNIESYKFFGKGKEKVRYKIMIDDHVNNTRVELSWDDILKQYHMLKLFGLLEDEQDEKEE